MKSLLLILSLINTSAFAFVVYDDTKIWNQDSITFYFIDGTKQQKSEVKQFSKLWQRYTGIKFNFTNSKPNFFSFKKFYKITFNGKNNESTKGAVNGLIQLGNLSDNIIYRKTTILHEFGHMLGLAHEHQRADRPNYLNNKQLIDNCMKNQSQSRLWCKDNLSQKSHDSVFVQSDYDKQSIMHYDLENINGKQTDLNSPDSSSENNSLSFTDKYYIALLYNQKISDKTLEKMHQQDLWQQQKFETQANIEREKNIAQLETSACKTLQYPKQSKDGKYCNHGFMIIGKDDLSIPGDKFKNCYTSLKEIQDKMNTHSICQLSINQLRYKRKKWNNEFLHYGNCKRLEPNEKNNQEFYCSEGFSYVTRFNDLIGDKTFCYGSEESAYIAMKKNPVCKMNDSQFDRYVNQQQKAYKKQTKTKTCAVVKRKYKHITCPVDFDYTIINSNNSQEPINNKCFATKFQAINAMKHIGFCQI